MQLLILPISLLIIVSFSLAQTAYSDKNLNHFEIVAEEGSNLSTTGTLNTTTQPTTSTNTTTNTTQSDTLSPPPVVAQDTTENETVSPTPAPTTSPTNTVNTAGTSKIEEVINNNQKIIEVPTVLSPANHSRVKSKVNIEVWAPESYSVDLGIQTSVGPAKALYLGTANSSSGKFVYEWNTTNTPNWSYTLIVRANYNFQQSLFANNINVIVDNPIPEPPTQKEHRKEALEKIGLNQSATSDSKKTTSPTNKNTATTSANLSTNTGSSANQQGATPSASKPSTATSSATSSTTPNSSVSTPITNAPQSASSATQTTSNQPSTVEKVALPESPHVESVANSSTQAGFSPAKIGVSDDVRVEKIENSTKGDKTALTLSGKASPNSIVTIYILSDPIVVTVKSDANGNWTYSLDKLLVSGEHEVFVTVAKPDGSLVRSEVANFAIAKASGSNQEQGLVLVADSGNKFQIFITYTAGLILLAVSILLGIFFFRKPQVVEEDVID